MVAISVQMLCHLDAENSELLKHSQSSSLHLNISLHSQFVLNKGTKLSLFF